MNFQNLAKIETADFYIDLAMRKAREKADNIRKQKLDLNRFEKSKKLELAKIETLRTVLIDNMDRIVRSFPSIDDLPEFYQQLIKVTLDYGYLKKSLGAVNWSRNKLIEFYSVYNNKLKRTKDFAVINQITREYMGRSVSTIKQIKKELLYLENARRTMKGFPAIKEFDCVAIAGFPNVGKSTLLKRMTTAKPEIADYSFTTKKLNLGILELENEEVQLIDTPGTLNRFEKMNYIERQADLALKYLANVIIYVFDPTESYSVKEQEKLFHHIKRFDKPIIVYVSKEDISDEAIYSSLVKRFKAVSFDKLKKEIEAKLREG
jgi:nucleolar GTP-binding protein